MTREATQIEARRVEDAIRLGIASVAGPLAIFTEQLRQTVIPAMAQFDALLWAVMTPAQRRRTVKRMVRETIADRRRARIT